MKNDSSPQHDEVEDFRSVAPTEGPKDDQEIYESGNILSIKVDELVNNEVAIKQLINSNNSTKRELASVKSDNKNKDVEIGLLRVTPFIATVSLISNVIGTIVLGFGVNLATGTTNQTVGVIMVFLGAIAILSGSLYSIFYPQFVRRIGSR